MGDDYQGCVQEVADRRIFTAVSYSNAMTPKRCRDFAGSNGYTYYATQWGRECFAGYYVPPEAQSLPGQCTTLW
jgi:hypothetical protein